MEIKSPITGNNNVTLLREINSSFLIEGYKKGFRVDVARFFKNIKKIYLYECNDTGYKFFYPPVLGDGKFYAELQEYPWYYIDWKWEHEKAVEFINFGDKVLEVGSAKGSFLKRLKDRGNSVVGLETNPKAVNDTKEKGVEVYSEYLDEFRKRGINDFDVICFFQVMEHISDVKEVMEDALAVLKVGGKLIVSVPNNDSFLSLHTDNYFNMPPHHAGLWDSYSLTNLAKVFNLEVEDITLEPLQNYHYGYYYHVKMGYLINDKFGFFGKVFNKLAMLFLYPFFMLFGKYIHGHTIIVTYKKNGERK